MSGDIPNSTVSSPNLYQVLELDKSATVDEIRKRLEDAREQTRIRSKIPRYRAAAAAQLEKLNQVEQVLLDPARRKQYDRDFVPDLDTPPALEQHGSTPAAEIVPIDEPLADGQESHGVQSPPQPGPQVSLQIPGAVSKPPRNFTRIALAAVLLLAGVAGMVGIISRAVSNRNSTRSTPAPIIDGRSSSSNGDRTFPEPKPSSGPSTGNSPDFRPVIGDSSATLKKPSPVVPKEPTEQAGSGPFTPRQPSVPLAPVTSASDTPPEVSKAKEVLPPPVQLTPPNPPLPTYNPSPEAATRPEPEKGITPPPVYSGPHSGTLIWEGELNGLELITIEPNGPSTGRLTGGLPGVPVFVQPSDTKHVSIVSPPAPSNGFQRLILRIQGKGHTTVRLTWTIP